MLLLIEKLFPESTKQKAESTKKEIIFECFDISHSHGEHTVASKSVLVNGKPDPKRYKKYRIKTLKTGVIDDFASMEEILTRRTLAALRGEDAWPDMIIIDGGKGQLSHAVEAIKKKIQNEKADSVILELDPSIQVKPILQSNKERLSSPGSSDLHFPSCGMEKLSEDDGDGGIPKIISLAKREEEVFLPGQSEPILLEK
jgi:excinuclease UvrABC nuclease subunit